MPEFIHNFTRGKMESDLDERMVPNGSYRDALNVTVATSEASNVGALQNLKGNTERKGYTSDEDWSSNYISSYSNPVCIGSIRHEPTECIYWFIASDSVSTIAEYNTKTKIVSPVLIDKKNILNFTKDQHITGINIVDDLLFFTDNKTEPKKINIKKFKAGTNSTSFNVHTKIPTFNSSSQDWTYNSSGADFTEADITVIKKSPLYAPKIDISTSTRSAAGQELPGTGVTPVTVTYDGSALGAGGSENNIDGEPIAPLWYNFTYVNEPSTTFLAAQYRPLPTYGEWFADQELAAEQGTDPVFPANMETVTIGPFNQSVQNSWQQDDIIVLNGSNIDDDNNTNEYQIRIKIDSVNGQYIVGKIQSIPKKILRFSPFEVINTIQTPVGLIVWEALLEEKDPMFEFEFPRFAYRWKYENNEYSCFSPFTEVVFEGDDFEYLSSDGYNLGMQNHIRSLIIKDWDWGSQEVIELDILFKKSRSNNIYVVDTIKDKSITSFELKTELIGQTVESNQILRPFDNVPKKALAQEISANRLIYANYVQNITTPKCTIELDVDSSEHPGEGPGLDANGNEITPANQDFRRPFPSIKTIRNYQLGIVFQDIYGRQTPVFTNPSATYNLGKENAQRTNKFLAKLNQVNLPQEITHAKYFIKDISNEYYNLALDRFYPAEDGNVWLSFPSSERNKVDEETYLILKKQHDNDNPSIGPCRYKILDISSKVPDFVATTPKAISIAECKVKAGFAENFSQIRFTGPTVDENPDFRNGFKGDRFIEITVGGAKTDLFGIDSGGPKSSDDDEYLVNLDKGMDSSASFMGVNGLAIDTDVTIKILENKVERLPEYEGRFFVKINRDTDFETNIEKSFSALEKTYSIVGSIKENSDVISAGNCSNCLGNCFQNFSNPNGDGWKRGFYWRDEGETDDDNIYGIGNEDGKYKLCGAYGGNGHGNGGYSGSPANSDPGPDQNMWEVYDPPRQNNNVLSIVYVGRKTLNEEEFGNRDGYVGQPMTDAQEGRAVQLYGRGSYAGEKSQVYTIKRVYRNGTFRGAIENATLDGSNQKDKDMNYHFSLCLILDKDITEHWVGTTKAELIANVGGFNLLEEETRENNTILSSTNPAIFETEPKEAVDIDIYYEASKAYPISEINGTSAKALDYFNVYSFGNAVESDRIRDDFNAAKIGKGVKVSSIFEGPYAEERRSSGLIFSGIYNSLTGINRTNQFIQAEPITKDLNPEYGSIQKLHSKNTNLVTLCEDKCLSILANKDALFNADGNVNVTSNKAVLGQAVPYAGEFGISTNPESFADYGFRSYFADKNRGTVIRLSQDGITQIALKGMSDFFSDNLPVCNKIIGSYNDDKEVYNITLDNLTEEWQDKLSATPRDKTNCEVPDDESDNIKTTTVSFKETVDGWPSRKSYYSKTGDTIYPLESGVSINDKYYTFNKGLIWEHASNDTYSNFYGEQYDCSVNVIINDVNESIKGFKTLNYSGTASRAYKYGTSTGLSNLTIAQIVDQQISPSVINSETSTPGWYTNYINTDMEEGQIKEFVKKENKYFNKIKGLKTFYNDNCDNNVDSSAFPTQGIGFATISGGAPTTFNITISVDNSCSTVGDQTPDVYNKFWYIWSRKGNNTDIRPETTDQNVKCAIENFYSQYASTSDYNQVEKLAYDFRYFSSSGVNVGTSLYYNNEPYDSIDSTLNGKYLYIDAGVDVFATPENAALNINDNSESVPDNYYVVTIQNGQITSKVQYNTLDACGPAPEPDAQFRVMTGMCTRDNTHSIDFMTDYSSDAPNTRPQSAKCAIICFIHVPCGGHGTPNINQIGTNFKYFASDGIEVGTQLYNEDGVALGANENGVLLYNDQGPGAGQHWYIAIINLVSNAHWANHLDNWKFIVYENGIITSIVNTNTLNNC